MEPAPASDRYRDKPEAYFGRARRDYVSALPVDPGASILELGCGDGVTGALALAEGRCGTYVGLELSEPVAQRAAEVLTRVHVGDAETSSLPYGPATFDALICSEVLEHLLDPEAVLRRLVPLLKPGALVFASAPNLAHWKIVAQVLLGRFDYQDEGVMDRTHVRWFTPRTFREMFERSGVIVDSTAPIGAGPVERWLLATVARPIHHLVCFQIDLRGRRRP